ncbi:MAG: DUF397 domain-containing protein [Oscillospiraceae bacterium]|nr:DUF397 domain-containing protein [Oscillospiraceae bacterium]
MRWFKSSYSNHENRCLTAPVF